MLASTIVTFLTLGAPLVEAGLDKFRFPRMLAPHKRATLYLHKRGTPPKHCRLKPASNNKVGTPTTTSATSNPTGGGGNGGGAGGSGGGNGKTIQVHSGECGSPNASGLSMITNNLTNP
jgi:hypothetical protein